MTYVETVQRIEPARLEEPSAAIGDVVAELSAASATLGKALHPRTAANLAALVRLMNAYYYYCITKFCAAFFLGLERRNMDIVRGSLRAQRSGVGAWLRLSLACGVQAAMAEPLGR